MLDGLAKLAAEGVTLVPIRHHSPACAWLARKTIETVRPRAVLVEGPADFDPLIPSLLDERTRPPVAIYTTPRNPRTERAAPLRPAAYYPLCDYSPELVALRAGAALGTRLGFVDLPYSAQLAAGRQLEREHGTPRVRSLLEESFLRSSERLAALARATGCRNADELWDHLFEQRHRALPPAELARRVAAYCLLARLDSDDKLLEADGTLAREHAMAAAISAELGRQGAAGERPAIVVVTGGFHTSGLLLLLASGKMAAMRGATGDEQPVLVRYGFEPLDALNGYAAGMPSPYYYQRVWQRLETGEPAALAAVAGDVIVEIGRRARDKGLPYAPSVADEIAALEHANRIAGLRGHDGPTREDVLDALRSCFVKGAIDGEGAPIGEIAQAVLAGDAVGEVPPGIGVPALVADFRARAERLGLSVTDSARRTLVLDLYRSAGHRRTSRFLHSLAFLDAPLGVLIGGPDFVLGVGLDLLNEQWEVAWSPHVEAALVEASIYGATVPEATLARLFERIAALEKEGQGRSSSQAVRMVIHACRMGVHQGASELLGRIEPIVADDPELPSVVDALTQLHLLWCAREPLEASSLSTLPAIAAVAYHRCCFLLRSLGALPPEQSEAFLRAVTSLAELVLAPTFELDRELLLDALGALSTAPAAAPALAGAAAGVMFGHGRLAEDGLLRLLAGHLGASGLDPAAKVAFLRGLFATCREAAWRLPSLAATIDAVIAGWSDAEFLLALPELRLAFATLTPHEVDRVAESVSALYGGAQVSTVSELAMTAEELLDNARIAAAARAALERDGLGASLARTPGERA